MELLYKYFDKFTNMIPSQVVQMIRLGAILLWLIGVTIVTYISWNYGEESAPELGQKLFLSNIKEEIAREKNIHSVGDVVLPDLDDLIRESHEARKARAATKKEPVTTKAASAADMAPVDGQTFEPANPVRAANELDRKQTSPVYQGEGLSPLSREEPVSPAPSTIPKQAAPRERPASDPKPAPSTSGKHLPFYSDL